MPCDLTSTQDAACLSGIGKVVNSTKLLQLIAQLTCEAAEAGGGGGGCPCPPDLIVDNINLDIAVPYNAAHGLGVMPSMVRCVLVFEDGSIATYSAGDEIDISALYDGSANPEKVSFGSSATNVWVSVSNVLSAWTSPNVPVKTGGNALCNSNVHAKLYIWT